MTSPAPPSSDDAVLSRLQHARDFARQAGELTRRYFCKDELTVDRKGDDSPVTIADREAETLLRRLIEAAFPEDAILGEEFPEKPGSSGYQWVLDPIDGTKSFIHGVPLYGTLIGILHGEQSLAGVIYIPALDEMAYAAVGHGAWHTVGDAEPKPARVAQTAKLTESLGVTSEVATFRKRGAFETFVQLDEAVRLFRTWGDCYGYLLVATGRADFAIDPMMNLWDAAALAPILQEAGGRYTDWRGNDTIHEHEGLGSNGLVHDEVVAITSQAPPAR